MARCDDGQNLNCGTGREYACWYCAVATFMVESGDLAETQIFCNRSNIGPQDQPCDPSFACPQYHISGPTSSGYTLMRNAPGCAPANSGGGLGLCGCAGTLKLFCACYKHNGVQNLSTIIAENAAEAERLLEMGGGNTNISIYVKTIGQSCANTEPSGACCSGPVGQETCSVRGQCGCAGLSNSTFYPNQICSQVTCGPDKRCCHCEWCCKVGTGGITEAACTGAGGLVQSGACPASGPCTTTNCKPCQLDGFSLAMNRTGNTQSVAGGYQPIAQIKAIDTTATAEATRVMHASLASKDDGSQYGYAARSCNIYNRRIGAGDVTKRRAVSECSLSATGGYGYQFICAYREPCSEPPTGCVRAAA